MGTLTSKLIVSLQDDLTGKAKAISGQVSKLGADLAKSQRQLGSIDLFKGSLQSLSNARTRMAEAQKNVEGLARQLRDARKAASEMASPDAARKVKELSSAFARAQRDVSEAAASYDKMAASAKAAREAFTGGAAISSIASQERALRASIDQTTAALGRQEQAAKRRAAVRDFTKGAAGAAALGAGYAGVRAGGKAVHAEDYSAAKTNLKTSGMSDDEIAQSEATAATLSSRYPTNSRVKILDMIRSQRAVTGDHGLETIEDNTKLRMIAEQKRPGEDMAHEFELLNKAMEIAGVTNDPKKYGRYMNYLAKAMNFFGGTLRIPDISDFVKRAGSAGTGLSERYFAGVAPTVASELGGDTAGTALATSYQQIIGGRMKTSAARNLGDYGLLDRKQVEYDKVGQVERVKPGGVKQSGLFMSDPDLWAQTVLLPALQAKGMNSQEDHKKAFAGMFPERNTQRMMELFIFQKQRLEKDAAGAAGAQGLEAVDTLKAENVSTSINSVSTAFENLAQTLSGPVLSTAIPALNGLTGALNGLADFGKEHPVLAGAAGLGALGGSAVPAKGGFDLLTSGFGLSGSATALSASAAELSAAAVRLGVGSAVPTAAAAAGAAGAASGAGTAAGGVGLGVLALPLGVATTLAVLARNEGKWERENPEELKKKQGQATGAGLWKGWTPPEDNSNWTGNVGNVSESLAPAISQAAAEAGRQGSASLISGFDLSGFSTTGVQAGSSTRTGFLGADFAGAGTAAGQSLLSSFKAATAAMSFSTGATPPSATPKPSTPGRASGGFVSARGIYAVGEHGPETFTPGESGHITPNRGGASGGRAAHGGTFSPSISLGGITIHHSGDSNSLAETVKEKLERSMRETVRSMYADYGLEEAG